MQTECTMAGSVPAAALASAIARDDLLDGGALRRIVGQRHPHDGPFGPGGVDHGRAQLERVEVESDAERPVGARGVDDGAPARGAGGAPVLLDDAGG